MAADYSFYLNKASQLDEQPDVKEGASGYFSTPSQTLDPHLFNGKTFRPEVRQWILSTLYDYWHAKYSAPKAWSTVWVAGSGISYQWDADRGNGDLDILIGVNFPDFYMHNPSYNGLSELELADIYNRQFHEELWPSTANANINGKTFEVTFYVNPNSTDIKDINPYAAYDLSRNKWTVHPPVLPQDPHSLYSPQFYAAVDDEKKQANTLIGRYNMLRDQAGAMAPNTPGQKNALSAQGLVVSQAKSLFDSIHLGRKNAFGPGGSGYGDYYNFRWQAHKQAGTVQALSSIAHIDADAREHQDTRLYGGPIKSASEALTESALWNTPYRRNA